jgi:hypothetical protein
MTHYTNTRNVQEVPADLRAILCRPGSTELLYEKNYLTRDELVTCIIKYYNLHTPASAPKLIKSLPELLDALGTEAYKQRKTATLMDLEVLIDALYKEEKISIPNSISRNIALASGYTKNTMIVEEVHTSESIVAWRNVWRAKFNASKEHERCSV